MKVAISGVTGLLGSALARSLSKDGAEIVGLTRRSSLPDMASVSWDVANGRFDASKLEGIDAIVHLAGEPVAQRWTEPRKRSIRDSRVLGTRLLVEGIRSLKAPPRVLVSGSAVGYYGDGGDTELTESSPGGRGFLADVCKEWEEAARGALELGVRVVTPRIGVVLSTRGGALGKMLFPFKMGGGGPIGSGRQWMPWIHIDDIVGVLRFALETELLGAANASAPNPVRNADFAKSLGKALHRPAFLPVPAFGLKLMFGEMATMLLEGQKTIPEKLQSSGFVFRFPELGAALEDVLREGK